MALPTVFLWLILSKCCTVPLKKIDEKLAIFGVISTLISIYKAIKTIKSCILNGFRNLFSTGKIEKLDF